MFHKLLDFFFPCYCISCGLPIGNNSVAICKTCYDKIKFITPPVCIKCSRPSASKICFECKTKRYHYKIFFSPTYYEGVIKEVIHSFKYQKRVSFKKLLASILKNNFPEYFKNCDYFIPVPLHAKRKLERGYNQSYYIAVELSKTTKIPVLNNIVLKKKYTQPQTSLQTEQRKKNILNVFSLNQNLINIISGKKIIIIDDVYTTGSTVNELARILKSGNPGEINVLTVARGF